MVDFYGVGRHIGNGTFKRYMEQDWEQTKADLESLIRVPTKAYNAGKATVKFAGKTVLYLTAGNLSEKIQTRLENKLGQEAYNAEYATIASLFSNGCVGAYIIDSLNPNSGLKESIFSAIGVTIFDFLMRGTVIKKAKSCASLPGKLISFPIETILGVYDGINQGRKYKAKEVK